MENKEFEKKEIEGKEAENKTEEIKEKTKSTKCAIIGVVCAVLGFIIGVACSVFGITIGTIGMRLFDHFGSYQIAENIYGKLATVEYILDNEFLYDYDKEKLEDYAALGITLGLGDPYTMYYSKDDFASFMDDGNGDFVGVGMIVVADTENGVIKVESVVSGSPAEFAGMLAGDIIKSVDGEEFTALELPELVAKIKGTGSGESVIGKTVKIRVERSGEEIDLNIVREKIHTDSVESKIIEDKIGYIKISGFNTSDGEHPDTYEEFRTNFDKVINAGADRLIIDLRDNGGGDLQVVSSIIDMIVPKGTIMYSEDKHGNRSYMYSDDKEINIPIVVLVNEYSASASELMTGALRDYEKCEVVGQKTYGKGVMQSVYPLKDGSGMVVTIAKYYTPNGICVHEEGIMPDHIVELNIDKALSQLTYEEDTQLQKAVEIIKAK